MQAIIRCGKGKYYCSPIFGMYRESDEKPFKAYVVCFDANKERLIKQPIFNPKRKPFLNLMVIYTDENRSGWIDYGNGYEGVGFLSPEKASKFINDGNLPADIRKACDSLDLHEDFSDFKEIKTSEDIEKLLLVTGYFHDGIIDKSEKCQDGSLYVKFDGIWGCKVELIFTGDVSYCLESEKLDEYDSYWYEASVIIKDGYIYLVDWITDNVPELSDDFRWFKAKSMKYRIIPE